MYQVVTDYDRREHFEFFRPYRNPFYAVTFELEFTRLKRILDRRGYGTYLNLCYLFTRAMQPLEDFRYRLRDGQIVLYEEIHIGMTVPAAGGLFSFAYLEYDPDIECFNQKAESLVPPPDTPPSLEPREHTNYIYFTSIPGVPFTGFTHATDDPDDAAPRVAFGKFVRRQGRLFVPVGVQVNHLFVDGRALGELFDNAERLFAATKTEGPS